MSKNLEFILKSFDMPVVKHPILSSTLFYGGLQYLRYKYPGLISDTEVSLLTYSLYATLGLSKEYIVEGRNIKIKNKSFYNWLLDNPKIAATSAALASGFLIYRGETHRLLSKFQEIQELPGIAKIGLLNNSIFHGILAGIVTESMLRGIKNIRRIKKSIRKIKTNLFERAYNKILEHPILLSNLVTFYEFNDSYSRAAKIHGGDLSGNLLEDIVNYPSITGNIMLHHAGRWSIYVGSSLIFSSVFHTHSLRELGLRTAKLYNKLFGRKEKVIEYQLKIINLPNSIERNIEDIVELGNIYYESNDQDRAYQCYRNALRKFSKQSDHISYADFFRRSFKLDKIGRSRRRKRYLSDNITKEQAINLMFIDLLNKDRRALYHIKEAAENYHEDLKLNYIYGRALEISGNLEEGRKQKRKVIERLLNSKTEIKEKKGSKNKIMEFYSKLFRTTIISKISDPEKLLLEEETTYSLKKILENFDNYDVPVPLGIVEVNGVKQYVMEYASGDLLADRIRENKVGEEEFHTIANFLALIHANLGREGIRRDSQKIINERLKAVGLEDRIVENLSSNLLPIIKTIDNVIEVKNKDAHSRNWIMDEFGSIIALDLENDRLVPLTYDAANLLDQYSNLTNEEKDKVLISYIKSFKEYTKSEIDLKNYRLAYLNSIIIRNLEAYNMLREQNKNIMFNSIENSQKAIQRIKESYPEYYFDNERNYEEISSSLELLKNF